MIFVIPIIGIAEFMNSSQKSKSKSKFKDKIGLIFLKSAFFHSCEGEDFRS